MEQQTTGIVVAVAKQRWFKVNRTPLRLHALDGAEFPCIVKIKYTVNEKAYTKRAWISTGAPALRVGEHVQVMYRSDKPSKAKLM